MNDRPEVTGWAVVAGAVLVLVFANLVVEAYIGRSSFDRLAGLVPRAGAAQLTEENRARVLYVTGPAVAVGQVGIGVRGQDRAFQVGDVVLLGGTGRLVRLEAGGRLAEVAGPDGAQVVVASLGPWDMATGALAGLTARAAGGTWAVEVPQWPPAGADLHPAGAPEEELTAGFSLSPPQAGRVRRIDTAAGPVVRVRPNGRTRSLQLEGRDPLPTLDNVAVTVVATVRASEGADLELALNDVVDAAGTIQKTADRREATSDDEWLTLRVQRRVTFGSTQDRYTVGLLEVGSRDWLEVREFGVYVGILP